MYQYKLLHDFKQYSDLTAAYIENLINNSMENFQKQLKDGQIKEEDSNALASCIEYVDDYLHYCFQNYPDNFNNILSSMINEVKTISVLPINERGIYGETNEKNKTIFINPNLGSSKTLSGEERTKLYMVHELGHVINNGWMKEVLKYCNQLLKKGATKEQALLIYDGFSMLDEATTQNRAEQFVYKTTHRNRPAPVYCKNARLFNAEPYKTNFDFYGELQAPATMFAKTLRGIGQEDNDVKALDEFSKRAVSPELFNQVLNEYTKDNQLPALFQELGWMGMLKRASYSAFGYGTKEDLTNSKIYLDRFKDIASKMRDYRKPFDAER